MKVLIVAPYFHPHIGGVESYVLNIALNLKSKGWKVVVVTSDGNQAQHVEYVQGLKVYYLKSFIKISNTPIGFRWRYQLKKIYKIEKPDIINGHTPVPYLADLAQRATAGNIPFVYTYHNDVTKDGIIYKIIVRLIRSMYIQGTLKKSDKIIATSEHYVNCSNYLKKFHSKIGIVPPGVDLKHFNLSVSSEDILPEFDGKQIILFVGSINKSQMHKGVDLLIEAFSNVQKVYHDCCLVIVGDGDAAPLYKSQVHELRIDDRVVFTGFVDSARLPQYYKRASVLVMASTDRNEGFGMVFIEAGAVGTPVIGTNVGGVPYAINDQETGLLIKPKSGKSLELALKQVLGDSNFAKKLGQNGFERAVEEFDWKKLADKTDKIFCDAMKPPIIQVAGYYPPHLGGMELVAKNISEQLALDGYDVTVMTSDIDNKKVATESKPNLTIKRFKAFEFAHTPFAFGFLPAIFAIKKRSILHLHLAQAFYPELVLTVAKIRRIPYVVHFHLDLQPTGSLGFIFKIYKRFVIRAVIRNAQNVIVFSEDQKHFIKETYDVSDDSISIIANGVSQKYFNARVDHTHNRAINVLYVGRLNAQKRVHILVSMMSLLRHDVQLTIAGDGEDRKTLLAQIHTLGLQKKVKLVGQIASSEMMRYYKAADVLVIASENEGMPLALLEAMASGLPIIGADAPGIRDLIDNTGVLVKNPSGASFAQALDKILDNPLTLNQMSEKSIKTARKYSWGNTVDSLEALYKKVRP